MNINYFKSVDKGKTYFNKIKKKRLLDIDSNDIEIKIK